MKITFTKVSLTISCIFFISLLNAQSVGINTTSPDNSAILEVASTSKGMLIPRMQSSLRVAISSPALGLLVFDTDTESFWYYQSTGWIELTDGAFTNDSGTVRSTGNYATDDFVFGSALLPLNGQNYTENLFFFDKSKGAFRTGRLNNSRDWAPDSIGVYSFAAGYNAKAKGQSSTSIGYDNEALGGYSTALGFGTVARGLMSMSFGLGTDADAYASTALGRLNVGGGNPTTWVAEDPIFEIGIGTSSSNTKNALTVLKNGKLGLGTPLPLTILDVRGNSRIAHSSSSSNPHIDIIDTNGSYGRIKFSIPDSTSNNYWILAAKPAEGDTDSRFNIFYSGDSIVGDILSITGSERVGINAVPSDALHINAKNGDAGLRVQIDGQTKLRVFPNGGTSLGVNASGPTNGLYVVGNTGLGTNNPTEKLEVNGAVVIGDTPTDKVGAIRFHEGDFEGYDGSRWISLTSRNGVWGTMNGPETVTQRSVENTLSIIGSGGFGEQVELSGNYAVVGAYLDTINGNSQQGSAFVYEKVGEDWTMVQNLVANDGAAGDLFGYEVDISGDYIIISSLYDISPNGSNGSVYIFKKNGNTWEQQVKIENPSIYDFSYFGVNVTIKGQYAVINEFLDDVFDETIAKIYKLQGGTWLFQDEISTGEREFCIELNETGEYVALGYQNATVNGMTDAGRVLIYKKSGSNSWLFHQEIVANTVIEDQRFGSAIRLDGANMVVSASYENTTHINAAGKVYAYYLQGTNYVYAHSFSAPNLIQFGFFGGSIDLFNDRLIVSQQVKCSEDESAFIYEKTNDVWKLVSKLKPSGEYQASFLRGVAVNDDSVILSARICGELNHSHLFFYGM